MKTIKRIMIIVSLLLCTTTGIAQTYYYTTTKTFNQSGYTYQCDVVQKSGIATLYNKANQLTYTSQIYKSTGKEPPLFGNPDDVLDDNWTRAKSEKIVNSAFSAAERQRMKSRDFCITMYISPNSGKVTEVNFIFSTVSPFATIPVSVYRKIETDLKSSIWFTPTADGKKLNYICRFWRQEISAP